MDMIGLKGGGSGKEKAGGGGRGGGGTEVVAGYPLQEQGKHREFGNSAKSQGKRREFDLLKLQIS